MKHYRIRFLLGLVFFSSIILKAQDNVPDSLSIYCIGNSHTVDFTWDAFLPILEELNIKTNHGWHIKCGSPLSNILANPDVTCVELTEYGDFQKAIDHHRWNVITLQTFSGSTPQSETEAVKEVLKRISKGINKNSDVYIYCSWPYNTSTRLIDFDYSQEWNSGFHKKDSLTVLTKKYFRYLKKSIEKESENIKFIHVGEVLYQFDQKARSGGIPGFTGSGELYRDGWHLNNVGRFIAGMTVFSQIFRYDPINIPDFKKFHTSDDWPTDRELTTEQIQIIKQLVSNTLEF